MRTVFCAPYTLEPQVPEHAHEMFAVLSDPAIYEFENSPPTSEEWLRTRFKRLETRSSSDGKEHWLNWVIRLPNGRLAGYVQATVVESGTACVAYEINSEYWRQGIGSCTVLAMLQELEHQYAVTGFVAVLKAENYRSKALLLKLGFSAAGTEQQEKYRDEPDELVMLRAVSSATNAA
jgi:RimJ/RimL family protein N-acetyltransferase